MVSLVEILKRAGKELYKHQLDFVSDALLLPRPRLLLADDVGLGKTIQALLLVKALLETGRVNNALVVVPRAVLEQWMLELERFEIPYHLVESPNVTYGHRVYLTTLDRAKKAEYLEALGKMRWGLVIIDEAHKIRLESQRERLALLCKSADGCLLLTATPHTGDPKDYDFLAGIVDGLVVRREKKDVEEYEGRRIFPSLGYWVVQVPASREEARALADIMQVLGRLQIEPIVRVVVEKRAMSSPASFLKTLSRAVGGDCGKEVLEEGELDSCLGNIAGLNELGRLAEIYAAAPDRKLNALVKLVERLRGRKILVFTEYATTAEYLFDKLARAYNCRAVDSAEGYARADCGGLGVMYATFKARERIDVGQVASLLAGSHETAVFISTDIMSEGVNLQAYNVVVNYEVVWSPTRLVQRAGRIWRFGQTEPRVLVVDMVLRTGLGRDEYAMYLDLLEKLYDISLRALPPQSYGEFEIYELSEDHLKKILEVGSLADIKEVEAYRAAGTRLEELRRRIERILEAREQMRWKPRPIVEEGLSAKLGYPYNKKPEAGGGYYVVEVQYAWSNQPLYAERLLVRLATPLSRSREVQEAVFREGAVLWDLVVQEGREVREDEREAIGQKIQLEVWLPLKSYVDRVGRYLRLGGEYSWKIVSIARARVEGVEAGPGDEFEDLVLREVRRSEHISKTELAAVRCAKEWLRKKGFSVEVDYFGGPRPFDLVVRKDGVVYVVEVKGKWARRRDDPISFTANEIDFASRFPNRYIVCVAYVDGDWCDLDCAAFSEFQKKWLLEAVRGLEYKYNAWRKTQ